MTTSQFDPEPLLKTVDHAAAMTDRWLFLGAFILLLLVAALVICWLVEQFNDLAARHRQASDAYQSALQLIIASQNETALKLAVCIERNTQALERCASELYRIQLPRLP